MEFVAYKSASSCFPDIQGLNKYTQQNMQLHLYLFVMHIVCGLVSLHIIMCVFYA